MTTVTPTMAATLPQQLANRDLDRLRAYREHLDFYNGFQWPGPRRSRERRLTFNYARVFVEKLASYLMSGLSLSVEALDASPQAADRARRAEAALRQVYEENGLEALDFDTEIDAAVLGDACFKVTWDPSASSFDASTGSARRGLRTQSGQAGEGRVRVSAPDVQGIFAWWQGDDSSRVWRVASRYQLDADEAERLYSLRPESRQGRATVVEVWTDSDFELWLDNRRVQATANPYGFIPFVIYPNLRQPKQFWGVSDIAAIVEPARELNRALSQLSLILELSGNPVAVLENVEDAQDIAVSPGAVWALPERARAYLLDLLQGGGIGLHTDYVDLVYRTLHDLSEAPRTAFGDNQRGLSGVALEMELHPLLQKVRRKRLIRSAAYRRRNEMVLRILEQRTGADFSGLRQRIVWGPVLPQDRSRLVRDEEVLVRSGIHSRRRAMEELGVEDPDAELERVREEGEGGV